MTIDATPAFDAVSTIWSGLGLPAAALDRLTLTGDDPVVPSSFRLGAAAQASIAAAGLAAAELLAMRSGIRQRVRVDMRAAAAECSSEQLLRIDGAAPPPLWDPIAGAYRCRDGRWLRLHTNFRHHRDGVLRILGCANDRAAVAAALERWDAADFEQVAADAGLVVAMMRSFDEWDAHPQARVIRNLPLVGIQRIDDGGGGGGGGGGDGGATPGAPLRPLSGVRVLDLTRIIAGPVCGRALAVHGADVLRIIGPAVPTIDALDTDTGRGKRSALLDLSDRHDQASLASLIREADVLVQSYRHGALDRFGFGPDEVARLRPGIVQVALTAYGEQGPWGGRRGFDSLVQTATGFNAAEARAIGSDAPKPFPFQALDHASGYLMALGAMAALIDRQRQPGSRLVRVSLARTGQWLRELGRVPDGAAAAPLTGESVADLLDTAPSGYGRLQFVRHAAELELTPAHWERPSVPYGHDRPAW